jgi:hypothetical protein
MGRAAAERRQQVNFAIGPYRLEQAQGRHFRIDHHGEARAQGFAVAHPILHPRVEAVEGRDRLPNVLARHLDDRRAVAEVA